MPLPTHKRILCGMPIGIVLMCWHSLTLGIDYSMWISTAPAYFSDILNHSGEYGSSTNETALLLDDATAAFSVAQSVWAAGQLTGCMAAAPLPRLLGFRWSFVLLVFLSCFGSVMYSVAGIIGGEGGQWLAWVGKALDGFGDGSVALGLSYIPITLFHDRKKMVSAMINYRMLMAFGMFLGGAVSLGLDNIDITQAVGSDGLAREFSGGDLVGWAMGIIYFPSVFLACCALDNQKPPVAKGKNGKGGAPCTPYFTQKSIFWLFLVFSYGLTGSLATYFLPVFPYCPGYCNSMASLADLSIGQYIGIVTVGAFFCGFLGALFNSVVSYVKRCNIGGLPILRADCILITTSIGLMYAGYRTFDTTASEVESSQLMFIAGVCLYFLASTSLSAGMAPVFKEVIPKPSLSAMMPLYKICLDGGKIVGPLYSDWASTESSDEWETRADVAFIPSILMYILISLAIFVAGKYLSTPDFKPGRGGPGHRPNDNPHVAAASKEEPKKTAEMTALASGSGGAGGDRPEVNSYENQGVGSSGHIRQTKASTSGYDLYSGTSMSYSQIADAKNIDSVKVSLVI